MTLPLFLVVDDVPTSRQAVMRAVVQALPAARVLTATSVAELRKALEHARVTTIIADAYLPDGNAQDVLGRHACDQPPQVVILSAEVQESQASGSSADGDVLAKPLDPRQLHAVLRAYI